MSASALRRRALLSGSMLVAAVVGYGRRAYAACVNSGGSTYQCSGANVTTQSIFANNAAVSTLPGFSVNTTNFAGITITGAGAISYTDIHASPVTAYFAALYVRRGSVIINSNGPLSAAYFGINARSYGTGAITITANGNVGTTGVGGYSGIYARNSTSGNDITVTTATGTTVSGRQFGINARSYGTGAITITANGDVTGGGIYAVNHSVTSTTVTVTTAAGTTVSGIYARNYGTGATTVTANGNVTGSGIHAYNLSGTNSSSVTVTTAAGTAVSGRYFGIVADNDGHGALTITANGDVSGNIASGIRAHAGAGATGLSVTTAAGTTVNGNGLYGIHVVNNGTGVVSITTNGDVTGTNGGIIARNYGGASVLSITTGAGTTVSGGRYGIYARNSGTGTITVTANGNVTGGIGISAINFPGAGTDLNVTTGAGTTVSGANLGIRARNYGTGALTVTANGDVTGTSSDGIDAQNSATGTNLSVTIGAGATVTGHYNGIQARNHSASALIIATNGHVIGGQDGIYAASTGGAIGITVAATGAVTSTGTGATQFAVETKGGPATVTVAGTVNGGAGGAVQFDQAASFANRLALQTGAVINGNVLGSTGTDTLALSGTGSGSFNVGQLVAFEAGEKTEAANWTLTGTNTGITTFSVGGGTLVVNGSLSNAAFAVTGATLAGTGTVGSVSMAAGGTFAPGSGVASSSMTVSGNLAFQSGALYLVQVSPASASSANVAGTATLTGGSVQAVFAPGSYVARSWDILHASGGRIGTFSSLSSNLGAGFSESLSYTATDVFLNLTATLGAGGEFNQNQQNVAGAINGYFNSGGALPPNFLHVFGLTGANLGNALTLLSGEASTGAQQGAFQLGNQFLGIMLDPFLDGRGGVGIGGPATGFAPERAALPEDIALAYAKVMKAPASNTTPVTFEQRWTA